MKYLKLFESTTETVSLINKFEALKKQMEPLAIKKYKEIVNRLSEADHDEYDRIVHDELDYMSFIPESGNINNLTLIDIKFSKLGYYNAILLDWRDASEVYDYPILIDFDEFEIWKSSKKFGL